MRADRREQSRAYYLANRERLIAAERERRRVNPSTPEQNRQKHLRRMFGITIAEYDERLAAQGGVCAICRRPETVLNRIGERRRLAIDHDHETGEIRGLLCLRCNRLLGHAEDSVDRLLAAADYLEGAT